MKDFRKRGLVPLVLFIAVFALNLILRRYYFLQKEYFGLYLDTPDYWNELWSGPHPLITLSRDFISQFYRFAWAGPLITALVTTGLFLLLRLFLKRYQILLAAVWLAGWVIVLLSPQNRERERWAKVEYASLHRQWEKVVAAIPPEAAEKDRVLIPYALLACSELGTLPQNIFRYPVTGPEDIDLEGELTRRGYFFTSLVNESLGCTNEAIHNTFQAACTTPHGTSHGTLRQLIKFTLASGNKAMALKYCDILEKSPLNAATARAARKYAEALPDESFLDRGASDTALVITHDTGRNLRLLARAGFFNAAAADRYRCLLLLQRDLDAFVASLPPEKDFATLPLAYQQALCLVSDPDIRRRLPAATAEGWARKN